MKSLKAKFRKSDTHEWNKNDERLLSAVEHGEVDKVASLLAKKGASAVKLDGEGKSALHVAATRGQTECLSVILAHGADVSLTDASGFSALHLAAKNNHQECAKKLIQNKCVVDAVDCSGKTALHHAAASGSILIVQLLCEHKCPINLKDSEGFTPLLLSAQHAHADVCRILLEWGADVNACDKNGRTAVMLASESSCVVAVQVLVQQGADLGSVDSLGHNILHYAKLSGSSEVQSILQARLLKQQAESDKMAPPRTPQSPGMFSPPYLTPTETPMSSTPRKFNYKEEELHNLALKEEIEKLQEEKSMLLETIEDLKQIVEQTEPKAAHCGKAEGALVASLQAKVTALCLENQQLSQIIKKRPAPQGDEGLEDSRPNSIDSNTSYHSTHADFEHTAEIHVGGHTEEEDRSEASDLKGDSKEEILLLKESLLYVQSKLQESQEANRSLQAQLNPRMLDDELRDKDMVAGLAELQAKLASAEEKYLKATQEVQALGLEAIEDQLRDDMVMQKLQRLKGCLEQEVRELREKLAKMQEEKEQDVSQIKDLESRLEASSSQEELKNYNVLLENINQEKALLIDKYKEAQEEIKMLHEALRGMVPVEAAAKDFEEMKTKMGEVIEGLQKRLLELSKSYSETKNELSALRSQLQTKVPESTDGPDAAYVTRQYHEQQVQGFVVKMEVVQTELSQSEKRYAAALVEIAQLKQEAETQTQSSVPLTDHSQVVVSLGSAIKELEAELEALKHQLSQKTLQVDALQNRLTVEKERTPDDTVSRLEHEQLREALEGEVAQLTGLLQDALRKQDEMALEVAAAWQEVKDGRSERQNLQDLVSSQEQENKTLSAKHCEAQELISHLKKQVENHVSSERDKNKKIDDLTKEVGKLKDALNSMSQLSYSSSSGCSSSTPKRQQSQQLDVLNQQIKQLQYQLAESKKQHHEVVSVYRMHLLYAVQGQMDEDVQKALKQILMMCKMPTEK
ncbi:ankycorbin isoform X2 [Denticeps clupeoides]|uniref:Ankycorbin n=1 Tax=Denticeps clupeoides TaxID=299321 RepID=A0AAY4BR27_9TELE|nr:ankycorbin isoform X2 [Denticeps clupeoides]